MRLFRRRRQRPPEEVAIIMLDAFGELSKWDMRAFGGEAGRAAADTLEGLVRAGRVEAHTRGRNVVYRLPIGAQP